MEWQTLIKNIAPVLGTALGGPFMGVAVKTIGDALNIPQATQDNIKAAIQGATPEQLAAIKNAENDFAFKMQQLGFEHAEAIAQLNVDMAKTDEKDRESARQMQIQTKSFVPTFLACATVITFCICAVGVIFGYAKGEGEVAAGILAVLITVYVQINNFNFGSSASSQNKDNLLARVRSGSR